MNRCSRKRRVDQKISLLANKVEQYKEEEDSLRKALISAQTLADKIVRDAKESVEGTLEQAQKDADQKRAEAEAQAQKIVADAKGGKRMRSCCKAKRMRTKFWAQLTAR